MNSLRDTGIVDPSLRPLDPKDMSPARLRVGVALFVLGLGVIILGVFVSLGQWLYAGGSVLIIGSLLLLARFRGFSAKPRDMRKLYGSHQA